MSSRIPDLKTLREAVGQEIGSSDWLEVTQERINLFAEATGDHQWIHTDPERARAESPYGSTIAHGFLTLSLVSFLAAPIRVPGLRLAINYGLDRVRFPSAVPVGSLIRARFKLLAAENSQGALRATWSVTVERQGQTKPCCIAEWIVLYYPA